MTFLTVEVGAVVLRRTGLDVLGAETWQLCLHIGACTLYAAICRVLVLTLC